MHVHNSKPFDAAIIVQSGEEHTFSIGVSPVALSVCANKCCCFICFYLSGKMMLLTLSRLLALLLWTVSPWSQLGMCFHTWLGVDRWGTGMPPTFQLGGDDIGNVPPIF